MRRCRHANVTHWSCTVVQQGGIQPRHPRVLTARPPVAAPVRHTAGCVRASQRPRRRPPPFGPEAAPARRPAHRAAPRQAPQATAPPPQAHGESSLSGCRRRRLHWQAAARARPPRWQTPATTWRSRSRRLAQGSAWSPG
eukprot:357299-Chlamydomonas_euryale.AAC.2